MTTMNLPGAELSSGEATEAPRIAGTYRGRVIVCGSGHTLWEDLRTLNGVEADLLAVNYAGVHLPKKPQHWVSLHPEHFQWWLPLRLDCKFGPAGLHVGHTIHTHSVYRCACVMHVWPKLMVPPNDGGSGLAACRIALLLGYEQVILAGVPLQGRRHFYDPPEIEYPTEYAGYAGAFKSAAKYEFKDRVRSMSGATRELLGAP